MKEAKSITLSGGREGGKDYGDTKQDELHLLVQYFKVSTSLRVQYLVHAMQIRDDTQ